MRRRVQHKGPKLLAIPCCPSPFLAFLFAAATRRSFSTAGFGSPTDTTGSCGLSVTVMVKCCASCAFLMPLKALVTFPRGREPLLASKKEITSCTWLASIGGASCAGCCAVPSARSGLGRLWGAGAAAEASQPGRLTQRSDSPSPWPMEKYGISCAFFRPRNCRVNLPKQTEPPFPSIQAVTSGRRASIWNAEAGSVDCAVPGCAN
mmetsp:Transcript_38606/g.120610  ORF Transcript_38606/g.120610 Transcript_38606/m.120610 type:complete len:206 (-) Transcript_38606:1014-1631(-)